ncbi:uncharacterized protein LOC128588763 [Nycticebus coucang]|uniref:uncharacterized protein LOC128588763 n=1 Tax=Nycticebus coucang TaxID=9470 RepID=UPI00234DFFC2|nr:uncharacterized protein LOC128588763 [Nycticebus coucang]
MAWTPLLLLVLSYCSGSLSQPGLTQPPSLSASPGASARLTCTLSSGFSVGNFWIHWYQQNPGSLPRHLLTFKLDSDKHQGSGVPNRFSGSKDTSANAGILHISGLQAEDEADYYCGTYHGNSESYTVLQPHGEVRLKHPCSPGLVQSPLGGDCDHVQLRDDVSSDCPQGADLTMAHPFLQLNFQIDPLLISFHSTNIFTGRNIFTDIKLSHELSYYDVAWHQQQPGKAPRYLMWISSAGSSSKGDRIPDRFSGSGSGADRYLTISNLQSEDEADYYCQSYDSSGADSQTVVIQEPSLSVSPGGMIMLTCGLSSGSVSKGYYPSWYQQAPGQFPRMLIYSTNNCPSGVPGRFSGSIAGNKATLTITGAQAEDESNYYCLLYMGPLSLLWGCRGDKRDLQPVCLSRALGVCTMAWTPFLLLSLLLQCTESLSQPVLTQPPSASASLGASVKLTCTLSSELSGYPIAWHQQQPGKAPRYLMWIDSAGRSSKGDGIPDRFSGSSSGADSYLTISNLQSEDEADYYCQSWDSSGIAQ